MMRRLSISLVAGGILAAGNLLAPEVYADDWPQWMGPGRDNIWREEGLLDQFPEGGPTIVWRTPVAGGYAGPAVADGKVYVTDYVTGDDVRVANFERNSSSGTERVLCLDAATGEELWKHEYEATYSISYPAGPRCTPVVHNGKVYTLGAEGMLCCLDIESGEPVWEKNLPEQYNAKTPLWGYATHPLIDGNKLICIVGGPGSHAVAFDVNTGEEIWRTLTSPEQGYSPPMIIEAGGVRQLILFRPNAVTSVDPETGKEYWSVPYEATNGLVSMSPRLTGQYLFAGGYSDQNLLLKLAADQPTAEVEWGNKGGAGISPVNVQPILDEDVMYGFDQSGQLMAVQLPSGERLWQTTDAIGGGRPAGSDTAFIVRQADRYWIFNELGELLIANLSPDGYQEIDRAKVLEPTNVAFGRDVLWCMPAFANKRMYVRNDKECICVDLAAESAN